MHGPLGNIDDKVVTIFRSSMVRQHIAPEQIESRVTLVKVCVGIVPSAALMGAWQAMRLPPTTISATTAHELIVASPFKVVSFYRGGRGRATKTWPGSRVGLYWQEIGR